MLTRSERDTLYNRLREHEAGEHLSPVDGCPDCDGWGDEARTDLGEAPAEPCHSCGEPYHGPLCLRIDKTEPADL